MSGSSHDSTDTLAAAIAYLERDALSNIVLLKHIEAYRDASLIHHMKLDDAEGVLVIVDAAAAPYDRQSYPFASSIILLSADDDEIARRLLAHVPNNVPVVFKLANETDARLLEQRFHPQPTNGFISFTSPLAATVASDACLTTTPGDALLALFATQDHEPAWLLPMIAQGRAFAMFAGTETAPVSACFAFENYCDIWEIGGVVTRPDQRGQGHAKRVVGAMLAELAARGKRPRYQCHEANAASIALAKSLGLRQFLHLKHFLHQPAAG